MKDEGNEGTPASGFVDEGHGYSLALSATEMQAARIMIFVVDQTSPQAWLDKTLIIETYGHASAQHPFDLGTATVNLSSTTETQIDNIQTELDDVHNTDLPAVKTDTAAILTDTNELQTDWADGGRLDLLLDAAKEAVDTEVAAIKTVTDTLTLAAIADAVHDEIVEGTTTLRKAVKLLNSMMAGKSSGGGTNTLVYRDIDDSKDRLTFTVDADGNRTGVVTDTT